MAIAVETCLAIKMRSRIAAAVPAFVENWIGAAAPAAALSQVMLQCVGVDPAASSDRDLRISCDVPLGVEERRRNATVRDTLDEVVIESGHRVLFFKDFDSIAVLFQVPRR